MRQAQTNNYISDQGELFTGTQKELMDAYGIKHRKGLTRPAGALAEDGSRWKLDDGSVEFKKPLLFLGSKSVLEKNFKTGKMERASIAPSETADSYSYCRKALKNNDPMVDLEFAQNIVNAIESRYTIVDNEDATLKVRRNTSREAIESLLAQIEEDLAKLYAEMAKGAQGTENDESVFWAINGKIYILDQERARLNSDLKNLDAPKRDREAEMKAFFPHIYG